MDCCIYWFILKNGACQEIFLPLPRWQYGEIRDGMKLIDPWMHYGCFMLGYQNDEIVDFVADVVASIDGKRIVHPKDFPIMMEFTTSTREGDSEEFNATRSGRASVALNPDCPLDILATLAKDEMWEIRYRVALNPSATTEILASIIDGSYPDSLEFLSEFLEATIALHKNSDASLLEKLASSENQAVRTAVACNPNASSQVVQQAKALGVSPKLINDTRLYWWFGNSDWTLADLENLQTE
jgi:hypothetical protein